MVISRRQLEIFVAVAETSQISKASKKIFLTPSGVSMALSELENQLGGSFFYRHSRSLILNSRGRFLLPLAKDIVCKIADVEMALAEQSTTIAGELSVAASTIPGNYVLPYLIAAFRQVYPKVKVNLIVNGAKQAEELVAAKKVDVGFIPGNINKREELVYRQWFEDEFVVICGTLDPLAKNDMFDMTRDFQACEWIVQKPGTSSYEFIKERLGLNGNDVNRVMEVDNPEALKRTVESNLGVAFISSLCLVREEQYGWIKCLKVNGIDMKRQLKTIVHRETDINLVLNEFLAFCDIVSMCNDVKHYFSSPVRLKELFARNSNYRKN